MPRALCSLTDVEALYGALSQQVFKGELDSSRLSLSGMKPEEEKAVATLDSAVEGKTSVA